MIPNQGTIISSDSIEDIQEIMQICGVLEELTTRLTVTMVNAEQISRLENLLKQKFKLSHKIFEEKVTELLNPHAAANAKTSYGGTSLKRVKGSIQKAKKLLKQK